MKKLLAFFLKTALHLYLKSLRIHVVGKEEVVRLLEKGPLIFMLWHDSLLLSPLVCWVGKYRPLHALISNSRDGNIPAAIASSYEGVWPLRVKHTGRAWALRKSCRLLQQGSCLLITPDGPRGPKRVIKKGMLYASQKERVPIIHVQWEGSKIYALSTWDTFRIPLPFSKITLHYSCYDYKGTLGGL